MVELSSLEIILTRPFRVLISHYLQIESPDHLKKYAFIIALLSCVSSGTVILFSLWTPYFTDVLGYTQLQINIIGGMSSMGMYLLLPIIGNLADIYGTVLLSLLSIITFVPSYLYAAWLFDNHGDYWLMTTCFGFIGFGTSCLYFAGLLTCANIYPDIKGLSISLPVTCYGLSSLISSKLIQNIQWFHQTVIVDAGEVLVLDISKIFKFFSVLYLIVGALSYTSSCILTIQKQVDFFTKAVTGDDINDDGQDSTNAGDSNSDTENNIDNYNDNSHHANARESEADRLLSNSTHSYGTIDLLRNDELITEADSIYEISHQVKYRNFLKDHSAYFFLAAFFLCVGPLEMYINNMGSLVILINKLATLQNPTTTSESSATAMSMLELIQPHNLSVQGKSISISTQVSYHAFFSTAIRLLVGALSDYLALQSPRKLFFKNGLCRVWLLLIVLVIGIIGQLLIASVLYSFKNSDTAGSVSGNVNVLFDAISSLAGLSYGGIFTIYPSVIASIWGVEILGSTWGSYMVAPAFSSLLFGIIYAKIYDHFYNYKVFILFVITAASLAVSAVLTLATWKLSWSKKGFSVF